MKARAFPIVGFLAFSALGACGSDQQATADVPALSAADTAATDSATSMTYLLRQFQALTREQPERLANAAASREELVLQFLRALEQRDTAALESMRVSPAEFSHLYFPESIFMRPPYELDPGVVWMQIDAGSNTGLGRALARHGGKPHGYLGLVCQPPDQQGAVRLHGCDIRRLTAPKDTVRDRMFGAILERDGLFKFLSLENRL